ncbi:MAG: ABC transporter ATP-binding protein [Thermodesulfobacteriota bacterium]
MLEVQGIDVFYGEFQALFQMSLEVRERETVITVGPNGAGKSTLLRAISGLLPCRGGSIRFLGQPIDNLPAHRIVELGIAHVPEGGRVFPHLTVVENLKIGSYIKRARGALERNLQEIYQLFPRLAERRSQLADTLSGGERQMLAIARSLMSGPRLILLDEPSSGLAPLVVSMLFDFVRNIKSRGYSILMVEQNVRKALELSDRAYLLESGKVRLQGTREEFSQETYIRQAYLGL